MTAELLQFVVLVIAVALLFSRPAIDRWPAKGEERGRYLAGVIGEILTAALGLWLIMQVSHS
jgi:hypothetical protein